MQRLEQNPKRVPHLPRWAPAGNPPAPYALLICARLGVALATLVAGCGGLDTAMSALAQSSASGKDVGSAAGKPDTPRDPNRPCDGSSPADLECHEENGKDGLICKVCVDTSGKEMARACSGGEPAPSPAVKCEEKTGDDGESCVICIDAKGTVVKQACSAPAPVPPPDPAFKCQVDRNEKGETCTICYDDKGAVVKQGCPVPAPPPSNPK
jgi:hypothetical protein